MEWVRSRMAFAIFACIGPGSNPEVDWHGDGTIFITDLNIISYRTLFCYQLDVFKKNQMYECLCVYVTCYSVHLH